MVRHEYMITGRQEDRRTGIHEHSYTGGHIDRWTSRHEDWNT